MKTLLKSLVLGLLLVQSFALSSAEAQWFPRRRVFVPVVPQPPVAVLVRPALPVLPVLMPQFQWFPANARFYVKPALVSATVFNSSSGVLLCWGYAYGWNGLAWSYAELPNVVLYPGQSAYVSVRNFSGYPFLSGDTRLFCRWY